MTAKPSHPHQGQGVAHSLPGTRSLYSARAYQVPRAKAAVRRDTTGRKTSEAGEDDPDPGLESYWEGLSPEQPPVSLFPCVCVLPWPTLLEFPLVNPQQLFLTSSNTLLTSRCNIPQSNLLEACSLCSSRAQLLTPAKESQQ